MERSAKHKLGKAGFVVTAACVIAWMVTFPYSIFLASRTLVFSMGAGGISCDERTAMWPTFTTLYHGWASGLDYMEILPRLSLSPHFHASLPFIWLFALLAFPSWWLWVSSWPNKGHCRKYDYDLTGNTSGFCPECGAKI